MCSIISFDGRKNNKCNNWVSLVSLVSLFKSQWKNFFHSTNRTSSEREKNTGDEVGSNLARFCQMINRLLIRTGGADGIAESHCTRRSLMIVLSILMVFKWGFVVKSLMDSTGLLSSPFVDVFYFNQMNSSREMREIFIQICNINTRWQIEEICYPSFSFFFLLFCDTVFLHRSTMF